MLQELTVILVTLLPLVSANNNKDEHYVSKGLKVAVSLVAFLVSSLYQQTSYFLSVQPNNATF